MLCVLSFCHQFIIVNKILLICFSLFLICMSGIGRVKIAYRGNFLTQIFIYPVSYLII